MTKPVRLQQLLAAIAAVCDSESPGTTRGAESSSGPANIRKSAFKLLLAEDNEVNQMVAVELLAEAGYACDVVGDGRAAVDAALSGFP